MAEGYFNDGTVNIELGAHVFGTPGLDRRNVFRTPHGQPASVLDSGGGILRVTITGQRLRANLGDAERYIYEILRALVRSEEGELGWEDNRGHQHVFDDVICISGQGEVMGAAFADLHLDFLTAERSAGGVWGGVPAAPGEYPGTATLQDYRAGGINLGMGGSMRIEMVRDWPLREIPRARGARPSIPPRGATVRFVIRAHQVAQTANLGYEIENLLRQIGPREVALRANGNVYAGLVLDGSSALHTDAKATELQLEFVQDIGTHGAYEFTTTTTLAATTTTVPV